MDKEGKQMKTRRMPFIAFEGLGWSGLLNLKMVGKDLTNEPTDGLIVP